MKAKYIYSGPIIVFDKYVGEFSLQTFASSEKEASNNLAYQYKKRMGLEACAKDKLAGRPVLEVAG